MTLARGADLGLRILHVLLSMEIGGVERGVQNIIEHSKPGEFIHGIVCVEKKGLLGARLSASVPVWVCSAGKRTSKLRVIVRLARRIHEFKPDVVHVRNSRAWLYTGLAWHLTGCPGRLVFSAHGLDGAEPFSLSRVALMRWLAKRTSYLLSVSRETANAFSCATGIPSERFAIIHSGVDVDRFRPLQRCGDASSSARTYEIICVGRLSDLKGHDILLKAFARLKGARQIRLHIVGDGPHKAELLKLAQTLGISEVVHFADEVEDVASSLQEADVFALASMSEGRPTSIMEAMAAGLPVVATRVGAVESLVNHGATGFLVEPGDVDGFAQALKKMIQDAPLRRKLGATAREVAVSQFNVEGMAKEYARIYRMQL